MIRRWQIRNFKSIKNGMGQLEFAPITLFAGANSSGKSSVIQSILLMMQTLAMRDNTGLLLNGELVSLGTVEDVWHNGILREERSPVGLEYKIEIDDQTQDDRNVGLELFFAARNTTKTELMATNYRFSFKNDLSPYSMSIENGKSFVLQEITPALEKAIQQRLERSGLQDIQALKNVNVDMDGFFPRTFHIYAKVPRTDLNWDIALVNPFDERIKPEDLSATIDEKYQRILKSIVKQLNIADFVEIGDRRREVVKVRTLGEYQEWYGNLPSRLALELVDSLTPRLKGLLVDERVAYRIPFVEIIEDNFSKLFLKNIRYLGANRIAPTVVFSPDITSQWSEVSINGANVAAALQEHSSRIIRWYDPEQLVTMKTPLIDAVVTWLRFFGLLDSVATEEQGKLGIMLKIRSRGVDRDLDLTSVGFGTSQLLPIIVQGLLTPPGGVFIVEQPEVHLHPHVQSQLAMFFVALTRANVQCIVETHSENLVNQLRIFIGGKRDNLRKDIKMYFAERDNEEGTIFQEVEIDRKGNIINWPDGFMDESTRQAEEMLMAILEEED